MSTKQEIEQFARQVIPLLDDMFGDGVHFGIIRTMHTNKELIGIGMNLGEQAGPMALPVAYLNEVPLGRTPESIANELAAGFQDAVRNARDPSGEDVRFVASLSKETILSSVIIQTLGRRRNREMVRKCPHLEMLDLIGVFRVPVGTPAKGGLKSILVTNDIAASFGVTLDELREATVHNMMDGSGDFAPYIRDIFDGTMYSIEEGPVYPQFANEVTNKIAMNGSGLLFVPEVLQRLGEKMGCDYFVVPSSIHEFQFWIPGEFVKASSLRKTIYQCNRDPKVIQPHDVLTDSLYMYHIDTGELTFAN